MIIEKLHKVLEGNWDRIMSMDVKFERVTGCLKAKILVDANNAEDPITLHVIEIDRDKWGESEEGPEYIPPECFDEHSIQSFRDGDGVDASDLAFKAYDEYEKVKI